MPAKSTIITLTYDELAAALKEAKQAALDNGSMTEPEGYSELEGTALAVADDCLLKGMSDLETALLNWAFDYLNGHRKIDPPRFTLKPGVPAVALTPEADAYLRSLKPGEEVIDCGDSCQKGLRGVVYESTDGGGTCVRWTLGKNWGKDAGKTMGTSVTHGTRRVGDVEEI